AGLVHRAGDVGGGALEGDGAGEVGAVDDDRLVAVAGLGGALDVPHVGGLVAVHDAQDRGLVPGAHGDVDDVAVGVVEAQLPGLGVEGLRDAGGGVEFVL